MISISNNSWSIKQLKTMHRNGKLRFDHPIQRGENQWDIIKKSLLVHTAASSFPILPVFAVTKEEVVDGKSVTVRYILDGKQRLTNMFAYIDNFFETIEMVDEVLIEGDEFEIALKEFDDQDEEVRDAILSKMITCYTIDGELATDEEIEDVFFRLNFGTPLTQSQLAKAKMGVTWAESLKEIGEHNLITEYSAFSKAQIIGEKHISAILQAMMMLDNYDYKNVSEKVIAEYSKTFKKDEENKLALFERIKDGMAYLERALEEKEKVLMKKVHFPMMLTTAVMARENQYTIVDFKNWLPVFKEEFKKKEEETPEKGSLATNYFIFTGKGSTDREKADGRMNEMARHFKAYVDEQQRQDAMDQYMKPDDEGVFEPTGKDLPF